jgi:four helix bundle protein
MPAITSFRQLSVWQKSMDLAIRCYVLARRFPKADQPVLGYQLQKSAVSVPSNIAEGSARHSKPHYVQHLWTAHASGAELETQLSSANALTSSLSKKPRRSLRTHRKSGA